MCGEIASILTVGFSERLGGAMADQGFGAWLQRQLVRREWNQSDLARRSGIHTSRISDWVNGKRAPSTENAERLADALGVSVDEVLTAAGHRPDPVDEPERAALIALLRQINLTYDREWGIRSLLEGFQEADRRRREHTRS